MPPSSLGARTHIRQQTCCAAGFQFGLCRLWVNRVGPKQAAASPDVRFTSDSDQTERSDALCHSRTNALQQKTPIYSMTSSERHGGVLQPGPGTQTHSRGKTHDGLRLLVTPFPQEEFNPTDDRRSCGISTCPMSAMGHVCGRRRLSKNFPTFVQHWSGAVMCPACLCGGEAAGHNALRGLS